MKKQRIIIPKKGKCNNIRNYERKPKSLFIIYADFESILVPEGNGKQNPEKIYTKKYQKHIACSYGYKFVCVDDKFSKPFKTYLGEDAVYNFINNMIKKLVVTKKDNEEKIIRTLLNVRYVSVIRLIIMLK